jgi:hypothetical protein
MEKLECALDPERVRRNRFSQRVKLAGRLNRHFCDCRARDGGWQNRLVTGVGIAVDGRRNGGGRIHGSSRVGRRRRKADGELWHLQKL